MAEQSDKLERLGKILEELDNGLTASDFDTVISTLVEFAKQSRDKSASELQYLHGFFEKKLGEFDSSLEEKKKKAVEDIFQWATDTINAHRATLRDGRDGIDGKDGAPGKDSDPEEVIGEVLSRLSKRMRKGNDLVDEINAPSTTQKISKDRIEGLDEIEKAARRPFVGGGITGRDVIQSYDLSPLLDGNTKTFNLPGNWTILSVSGTSFPYTFRRFVDYTFTTQSITFTDQINAADSLAAGQTVEILYVRG